MSRFIIEACPLDGLRIITQRPIADARGHLTRLFCETDLQQTGWNGPVAQSNLTLTRKRGSLRGLHFQHPPCAEDKIITCLRGQVFDVAVDIRRDSPSFLRWHGIVLSAEAHNALYLPKGFAHGFQTLTDDVEMLYFHSAPHAREYEAGLNAMDPALGIEWPLPLADISDRDRNLPATTEFKGISV